MKLRHLKQIKLVEEEVETLMDVEDKIETGTPQAGPSTEEELVGKL